MFSLGGLVLDYTVVSYDAVAIFQPVINGTYTVVSLPVLRTVEKLSRCSHLSRVSEGVDAARLIDTKSASKPPAFRVSMYVTNETKRCERPSKGIS